MAVLTVKQRRFVEAYLSPDCPDATTAARIAGYKRGAAVRAYELLRNPKVVRVLWEEQALLREKHQIDRDRLVVMLLAAYHGADAVLDQISAVRELARLCGLYPLGGKRPVV